MQPTYYVQHPDGSFSVADPQPVFQRVFQVPPPAQLATNLSFDAKEFLIETLKSIQSSVDYAYPNNRLDIDNAHPALTAIQGKVSILKHFINALK